MHGRLYVYFRTNTGPNNEALFCSSSVCKKGGGTGWKKGSAQGCSLPPRITDLDVLSSVFLLVIFTSSRALAKYLQLKKTRKRAKRARNRSGTNDLSGLLVESFGKAAQDELLPVQA